MDKTRNKIISDNIRKHLTENNKTQKQLADAIGVAPSTLTEYMKCRSNPSWGVIQRIADYFGVKKTDIDTTWLDDLRQDGKNPTAQKIVEISEQLHEPYQEKVYSYAKKQLKQQNQEFTEHTAVRDFREGYNVHIPDTKLSAGETSFALDDPKYARVKIPKDIGYPDEPHIEPFRVCGQSMEGKFFDGDVVWVDTRYRHVEQHCYGAFFVEDGKFIKKMGCGELVSVNSDYGNIDLKHLNSESWHVVGLVIDRMSKEEFEEILNIEWRK